MTSDADLLRHINAGMAEAFQILYQRHYRALYRYSLMRCGSSDTAADLVQEVFMGVLQQKFNYEVLLGKFEHFLFGVVRHMILKNERLSTRFVSMPDGEDEDEQEWICEELAPLPRMLSQQLAEQLRQAVVTLPSHYRDVFILYELHDLSYVEIAQVCDVNLGTVRSRLARARAHLHTQLVSFNHCMDESLIRKA